MNFLGIGPLELVIIMVVALVIFGPQRLPEIGAQIGKAIRDFRQMTNDVTGEFQRTMTLESPPPAAALDPQATSQEATAPTTPHANGAGGPDATELTSQAVVADPPSISAEEPWTPPADAAPPVATKADPLVGASLLDETPATKAGLSSNGAGAGEVPADTAVTYTPVADTVPASFPAFPASVAEERSGDAAATGYSSAHAWDAVVNTEATLPRALDTAEVAPAGEAPAATAPEPIPYVYTPTPRERIDPGAEVTIREKIEAQVAAEAFRERRRIAAYNRPRKKA